MDRPFLKILSAGCYDFREPVVQQIKVASTGLRGSDLNAFIKRAGYQFADKLRNLDLKPGDIPVHLLAVGATEDYGANRNGDGFSRENCRKSHNTFEKYARVYRHHLNKDPKKSYGLVKHSAFNEAMKRIELLVFLNGTKEAVDRNGGLLADEELECLEKDEDIPVSMSCKVAHDICSGCGNKARSRDEYCKGTDEGGLCKAGGLKHRIGTVTGDDDNPILHADNPDPIFFDISKVIKPADRIAYSMGLLKAGSTGILTGAELAEEMGLTAPNELLATGAVADMYKIARKLAEHETIVEAEPTNRLKLAFVSEVQNNTDWTNHGGRVGDVLQALSRQKIVLPLEGFLQLISQDGVKAAQAASQAQPHLPGIYNRLIKSGELDHLINANSFMPTEELSPLAVRRWAEKKAADYSLDRKQVDRRILYGSIRHKLQRTGPKPLVKSSGASSEIAKHYAMYKLAFLQSLPIDVDFDLTLKLCVVQNYL